MPGLPRTPGSPRMPGSLWMPGLPRTPGSLWTLGLPWTPGSPRHLAPPGRRGPPGRLGSPYTWIQDLLLPWILLTVVVIFRILIVAIVGETVYEDEQTMFMCNTLQPGCNQACYDKAFPISHIRYWVFQIILVCTPSLCFITYSVHQSAKQRDRRYSFLYPLLEKDGPREAKKAKTLNGILVQNPEGAAKEEPDCLEVVFRNALEIGFLAGQYFLYGFNVPAIFECDRYPCVKEVECYVSRPTEKTVFLVFMFAVSGICVLLNLAELNHLGWRKVKTAIRGVQARRKSLGEVRKKDLSSLAPAPALGRTQSSESAYV
ncbi:gap junction delta-2 protein-like isoform X2 [Struthio camelus]|uniref:gap junction delta-2 protein-like isoform X2 n=1 Tax=Struthio camelus TaxID=8801 RepID=UPI003603CD33